MKTELTIAVWIFGGGLLGYSDHKAPCLFSGGSLISDSGTLAFGLDLGDGEKVEYYTKSRAILDSKGFVERFGPLFSFGSLWVGHPNSPGSIELEIGGPRELKIIDALEYVAAHEAFCGDFSDDDIPLLKVIVHDIIGNLSDFELRKDFRTTEGRQQLEPIPYKADFLILIGVDPELALDPATDWVPLVSEIFPKGMSIDALREKLFEIVENDSSDQGLIVRIDDNLVFLETIYSVAESFNRVSLCLLLDADKRIAMSDICVFSAERFGKPFRRVVHKQIRLNKPLAETPGDAPQL